MRVPESFLRALFIVPILVSGLLLLSNSTGLHSRRARFDWRSEFALVGTLQDTTVFPCPLSAGAGTHLVVSTLGGPVIVHLGPSQFINGSKLTISNGEKIEILGWAEKFQGNERLIAREIVWDDHRFIVRLQDGKGMWER